MLCADKVLAYLTVCRCLTRSSHSIGWSLSFPSFNSGPNLLQADAQPYHLSPSGVQQVNEGGSFVFNCTVETGSPPIFVIFLNDSALSGRLSLESISGGGRYTFGPVTTSDSGSILRCSAGKEDLLTIRTVTLAMRGTAKHKNKMHISAQFIRS